MSTHIVFENPVIGRKYDVIINDSPRVHIGKFVKNMTDGRGNVYGHLFDLDGRDFYLRNYYVWKTATVVPAEQIVSPFRFLKYRDFQVGKNYTTYSLKERKLVELGTLTKKDYGYPDWEWLWFSNGNDIRVDSPYDELHVWRKND